MADLPSKGGLDEALGKIIFRDFGSRCHIGDHLVEAWCLSRLRLERGLLQQFYLRLSLHLCEAEHHRRVWFLRRRLLNMRDGFWFGCHGVLTPKLRPLGNPGPVWYFGR